MGRRPEDNKLVDTFGIGHTSNVFQDEGKYPFSKQQCLLDELKDQQSLVSSILPMQRYCIICIIPAGV